MRIRIILFVFIAAFIAACNTEPPLPTVAVLPTDPGAAAQNPSSSELSTATPTVVPSLTPTRTRAPAVATPTPFRVGVQATAGHPKATSKTPDGAITFDDLPSKYESRRITFLARITPHKVKLRSVTLIYTYPTTKETKEQDVPLTPQTLGKQMNPLQWSMPVDNLPNGEDEVLYKWQLIDENMGGMESEQRTFKITEAITAERRDDLPIIDAKSVYKSEFPKRSTFSITLTPAVPIAYARFYMTQNNGILLRNYSVRVPTKKKGETLALDFKWDDQLALQIPWQQFEWWWVLTDQNGKVWRTKPQFNDYADNRFHKWKRIETKHAVLYSYGRSNADVNALVKATDESYERLAKMFGYKLVYRPHVVVYNTQSDFSDWAPPSIVDEFIGMASGEWGGCVVTFYDSIRYTGYNIIQHELVHLFQYQSIRDRSFQQVPKWWYEGSARYFETANDLDMEGIVRRYAKTYGPTNLEVTRETLIAPDGSGYPWPYFVGMTVVRFLRETYGEDAFRLMHLYLARDLRFGQAVKLATGKDFSQFNVQYQQWIAKSN